MIGLAAAETNSPLHLCDQNSLAAFPVTFLPSAVSLLGLKLLFIPGGWFELNHIAPTSSHLGMTRINEHKGRPADGWDTESPDSGAHRTPAAF